ncbi:putative oxidoreductase YdhV [Pelotomaculum schinkii]|uniref:Putative oxidoreductase YdhV n=1 Tax=Pelotomaculum schinkii TaxID=78350 RepID=A0A4Y7R6Q9_9FIRM|nr:aldehyde ferredoxin oxidoreductase family protein [Pelotomaculum schinkii]TEB04446.1 putative oxidoreductase YdhV [Pelotomaculum schinkii]
MYRGGFTGRVLRIDLTNLTYQEEKLDPKIARQYMGGAGLGIKYLYDELEPGIDPLGPSNKLIFTLGPLTGTSSPCASRMSVTTKSPLSNTVGVALTGGKFPAELKRAGYDAVIVEGRAESPTYVYIHDGKVDFKSAAKLWGTNTFDCQDYIRAELHNPSIKVACIGPAGEKLVRYACIINERRAAGRKGVGAVMGSKNLKAIAVKGDKVRTTLADPEKFKEVQAVYVKHLKDSPYIASFGKTGTSTVLDATSAIGICSAKNYSETGAFQAAEFLGAEANAKFDLRKEHCEGCPVGCSQVRMVREGQYAGSLAEGPEFETLYSLGTTLGNTNLPSVIAGDRVCDELGLDSLSVGVTIGFAMEMFEKGVINLEDTGGMELKFGKHEVILPMLRMIAYREGFGDILAEGVKRVSEKYGKGSEKYAMHIKGLEFPAYDIRGAKAHGLGYATSYTGADHSRGYAFQEIFAIPVPYAVDRFAVKGKGKLTMWNQDVRTVTCDCAPMCAFILDMAVPDIALENTAGLVGGATGWDITPEEVYQIGERVINTARLFNIREGFTRADDTFPERIMTEPIPDGPSKGELISQSDLDLMLDEYYEARGWTKEGVPTKEKLKELDIV